MVRGNWSPCPLGRDWGSCVHIAGSREGSGGGQQQPQYPWEGDLNRQRLLTPHMWQDAGGIRHKMEQERFRLKIRRNSL